MKGAALKCSRPLIVLAVFVVAATTLLRTRTTDAFVVTSRTPFPCTVRPTDTMARLPSSALQATEKKSTRAKGFGKVETTRASGKSPSGKPPATVSVVQEQITQLSSVNSAAVSSTPLAQPPQIVEDDSSDPEERAKSLLREKYGMKSLAEQQMDAKQLELRKEQQKKLADWKAKAERGGDFDIMSILPAPVLIAIDRFLKLGTAVCTVAFVTAGILITAEAGSKALESPLPENLDQFIVNTVEPNFTPGLFVLLGFSVSLGIFAALQLGSQGSTYKED